MPVRPGTHKPRQPKTKTHIAPAEQRRSSTARGYGYKWQQASKGYLAKHPLCADHERRGKVALATCVDHIIPHNGDMELFWDRSNWQGLCTPCHSRKTASEDGGFGNAKRWGGSKV